MNTPIFAPHRRNCWRAALVAAMLGALIPALLASAPEEKKGEPPPRAIAIITHLKNKTDSITRAELTRMFLKQQTVWPDGARCIPIDQRGDSAIRSAFSKLVLRRSVYEVKRYWMQETMTGDAKPPVSLESAATVKKYVQRLAGSVAYIYEDEVDDTVKVVHVTDVPELTAPEPVESNDEEAVGKHGEEKSSREAPP